MYQGAITCDVMYVYKNEIIQCVIELENALLKQLINAVLHFALDISEHRENQRRVELIHLEAAMFNAPK